ncbi:MAG: response regulator transcription factor [Eubacteriaceae bacterium]|jgi:DNA-binding response OmpR family regulator|nr:response regulator transcription factor [Eubacteriaceae bacterium]
MSKDTILIVDDDTKIQRILNLQLTHNGYETRLAQTGTQALELFEADSSIGLVLLDIMLPEIDGISLCHKFKKINSETKILIVSAKDKSKDVIEGLDSGADDYIKKPFVFDELLARIRANLRKPANSASVPVLSYKDLEIDVNSFSVKRGSDSIELSRTEFDLLHYLVLNNNLVQSREQILDRVWGYAYYGSNNIVDVYIKYLRDKVDRNYSDKLIQTVRGRGYVVR